MSDREVKVKLTAEVEAYKRQLAQAETSTRKFGGTVATIGDKASAGFGKANAASERLDARMSSLGEKAHVAGAAILVGLGVGLVKAASDASNLNETVNKSQVLFGAQAESMKQWASGAAQSMGLSTQAALEAAAGFGDMFKQLGFSGEEAARMSQQVVQLSADLGSFNNVPTAEVTEMISASMRGEYDSLQRLIPNISAARVEHEALAMTGKSAASSLTAQEKAAATLAIVQKDGARASGDFARTSDQGANSIKRAQAEYENASAALGTSLLPAMTKAADIASTVFGTFAKLPGPLQTVTVGVVASAGAFLFLAPKIVAVRALMASNAAATIADTAATEANTVAKTANAGALRSAASGLAGWPGLAAAAATATTVYAANLSASGKELDNWQHALIVAVSTMNPLLFTTARLKASLGGTTESISNVGDVMSKAGVSAEELEAAHRGDADALATVKQKLDAASASSTANASASTATASSVKSVAEAAAAANGNVDEFAKKLEALIAPGMAAQKAADGQRESLSKLSEAAKTNGTSLQGSGEKARANREAFMGAIQANVDLATAYARLSGSVDQGKAKYDEASAALVRAGVKAGFSEKQIRAFIKSMNAAGDTKATPKVGANISELKAKEADVLQRLRKLGRMTQTPKVKAETAQARAQLADIREKMAAVQDKTVTLTIKKNSLGASVGAASGGYINVPGLADGGGPVRGPGTRTSDSIPAMLSNGEYVVRASAVDKYGVDFLDRVNAHRYAGGGKVFSDRGKYNRAKADWQAKKDAYDNALSAYNDRVGARDSAVSNRVSRIESVMSSFRSSSGVMNFDFGAYESARSNSAQAVRDQADAEQALWEARKKANAASKADRPEALRALADAQQKYADAVKASASAKEAEAAANPTSGNILQSFRDRVTKMQGFAGNLRTLAAWGFPGVLLGEILNSGLESGSQMAAALVQGGPGNVGEFINLASLQTDLGNQLGAMDAAWSPQDGGLTLDQQIAQANAAIGGAPRAPGAAPVYAPKKKKKKRALGGPVTAGEPYLVGEQGLEMFVPGVSGSIVSSRNLHHALAAGSGGWDGASAPLKLEMPGYGEWWSGLVTYNRRTGFSLRALDGS